MTDIIIPKDETRNYYIKNNTGKGVFLNGGNCNIYLKPGDELGILSVPSTRKVVGDSIIERDDGSTKLIDVKKIGEIEIKEDNI